MQATTLAIYEDIKEPKKLKKGGYEYELPSQRTEPKG